MYLVCIQLCAYTGRDGLNCDLNRSRLNCSALTHFKYNSKIEIKKNNTLQNRITIIKILKIFHVAYINDLS